MKSAEIREAYLRYFESKGCRRLPSSSLIPDDPSLLLTTAGMVQFKPLFLGVEKRDYSRATTCQKCVRTTDIDIIGRTGRHHSFFEMLGNFSFGDYFKSEACAWAYEFSTEVLGFDPDRLWYSIYEDDDEAEAIWRDEVGVPADRIVRMGAKDNFWSAGPTGPCGPCSELYYDQGPEVGCGSAECAPGCDCDRFLEYWNLVFMQYDRQEDGTLVPLPKKNIDTGMGLERVATILQGVHTNFETDILRTLIAEAESRTSATFGAAEDSDVSLRILADHSRAVTFMIADGILPSNEGRGYVLRRLLRRALAHSVLLGATDFSLVPLIERVFELMGDAYPEIIEQRDLIVRIVSSEEHRFSSTLRQGLGMLQEWFGKLEAEGVTTLPGDRAFMMHDTYGFPIELTIEMSGQRGFAVDLEGFEAEMNAQRERGRAAVKDESWKQFEGGVADVAAKVQAVEFVGYAHDGADAVVVGIVVAGHSVEELHAGQEAEVILDRTPFYGEQGGQVGDTGDILAEGTRFAVADTKIPLPNIIAHRGSLAEGVLRVGDTVRAEIDRMRRERIRRNHTATHLLHWALRLVLGEHVRQSGSFVSPERMRFDFTHFEGMTGEQLAKLESLVNAKIMEDHPVRAYETSLVSAREAGVTALFGEKYGEFVRVLEIGNFSKELCGGTHVGRTSEIGFVKIASEGSVGANLRRIEAVTSFDALRAVHDEEAVLARAAEALRCRPAEVADKAEALARKLRETEAALAAAKRAGSSGALDTLVASAIDAGYPLVVARAEAGSADELRDLADAVRAKLAGGAVVLAAEVGGKALLLAAGTDAAVAAGFDAGAVIRAMAPKVGGGGGGKPQMAQAGGKDPSGIDEALAAARAALGA